MVAGALVVDGAELLLSQGFVDLTGNLNVLGANASVQTAGATVTIGAGVLENPGTIQLEGGNIGGRVATGGTGTFDTLVLGDDLEGSGIIGRNSNLLDDLNLVVLGTKIDANVPGLELILADFVSNDEGVF